MNRSINPRLLPEKRFGGRASVSGMIATVFGSSGFLGSKTVNRLGKSGVQVVVPFRGEENAIRHLRPAGDLGQIVPVRFDVREQDLVDNAVEDSNVVINCIGRQWRTLNFSLEEANAKTAENVAKAVKAAGIKKFIHVSAAGASPTSRSAFLRAKYEGEQRVRDICPHATIIRPCHMFGMGDSLLFTLLSHISRSKAAIYLPRDAKSFQPVYVSDVVSAIMEIIATDETNYEGKIFELGGPTVYEWEKFAKYILEKTLREHQGITHFGWSRLLMDYDTNTMRDNITIGKGALTFEDLGITDLVRLEEFAAHVMMHFTLRPISYTTGSSSPLYELVGAQFKEESH